MYKVKIRELLSKSGVDISSVDNDSDLIENATLDSLGLIALISMIEDEMKISLDATDYDINNFRTINTLCAMIRKYK